MATPTLAQPSQSQTTDFLPLKGTDHVEFYVGNARQAAYFYRAAFGMSLVAYAGPETGQRDRASYVLQQGKVRFVLTTALRSASDIARHVDKHGDGVRAIALWVDDARQSWLETTSRGARSIQEPTEFKDEHGSVITASIAAYGDTVHTFVERTHYTGAFLPGYKAVKHDHIATIHQVDEEGGVPFLAMEFLVGETLHERLDRDQQLPLSEVLRVGPQRRLMRRQLHVKFMLVLVDGDLRFALRGRRTLLRLSLRRRLRTDRHTVFVDGRVKQ